MVKSWLKPYPLPFKLTTLKAMFSTDSLKVSDCVPAYCKRMMSVVVGPLATEALVKGDGLPVQ